MERAAFLLGCAAFPTPAALDAEIKDMRTCMQLFKMNLGLHNPVEYNVEENSLLRVTSPAYTSDRACQPALTKRALRPFTLQDFHTQLRASHVRCGFLLAEAKDEPTKGALPATATATAATIRGARPDVGCLRSFRARALHREAEQGRR